VSHDRKRPLAPLLALLSGLVPAAPAGADLYTPSFIADDGETAVCQLLNLGSKPVEVEIQIRFNNGVVADGELFTVPPQELRLVTTDGTNSSRLHCAFLGKVSAKSARAAGEVSVGGQTKLVVPAQ
jgi:hypothetical protein